LTVIPILRESRLLDTHVCAVYARKRSRWSTGENIVASDEISPIRRKLMQGAGAGLLAAAAGPALSAETGAASGAVRGTSELKDPRDLYPHPPFEPQSQPWPGLAGRMKPRPDHGERSYHGSGRLADRKALITGGDSGIGRAAAVAFAREGADVAICYLPQEEEDAREVVQLIQSAGRKAVPLPGDIRDEAFCRQLVATAVSGLGGLDILVNNAGRQQSHDSILDITNEQFDWTFKTNVYAMFWITKAAILRMPPGSAIINTSSVNAFDPSVNLLDSAEMATVYVQLASAESSYVTGQVYGASGGSGQP
jgi:NAD(P)-dependent dehydrogenase (short-subunit alcohol dehydrogenase family)